jgi:DNA-binding Lrp family transcriptional regulator
MLNEIQADFPQVERPFQELAMKVNYSEEEVCPNKATGNLMYF